MPTKTMTILYQSKLWFERLSCTSKSHRFTMPAFCWHARLFVQAWSCLLFFFGHNFDRLTSACFSQRCLSCYRWNTRPLFFWGARLCLFGECLLFFSVLYYVIVEQKLNPPMLWKCFGHFSSASFSSCYARNMWICSAKFCFWCVLKGKCFFFPSSSSCFVRSKDAKQCACWRVESFECKYSFVSVLTSSLKYRDNVMKQHFPSNHGNEAASVANLRWFFSSAACALETRQHGETTWHCFSFLHHVADSTASWTWWRAHHNLSLLEFCADAQDDFLCFFSSNEAANVANLRCCFSSAACALETRQHGETTWHCFSFLHHVADSTASWTWWRAHHNLSLLEFYADAQDDFVGFFSSPSLGGFHFCWCIGCIRKKHSFCLMLFSTVIYFNWALYWCCHCSTFYCWCRCGCEVKLFFFVHNRHSPYVFQKRNTGDKREFLFQWSRRCNNGFSHEAVQN